MTTPSIFDAKAVQWDANPRIAKVAKAFADSLRRHLPLNHGMRAIDFGCGTGQVGILLQEAIGSLTMVDTSQGMLTVLRQKIAEQRIDNMHLYPGDLFQTSLAPGSFDLAYTLMALHHLQNIPAVLNRFHQLLKPGGFLCIGDLEPEDGSFHGGEMEVHQGFDPRQMGRDVADRGFQVQKIERLLTIQKPDQGGTVRTYPLFFLMAQR